MTPSGDVQRNPSLEDEGLPDIQGSDSGEPDTGEGLHQTLPPRDHPQALDDHGTTAREQREGEPLSVRLDREERDSLQEDGEEGGAANAAGRLVEPGSEAVDSVDSTPEATATDVGYDRGGFSAEEAAIHIEE